MTTAEYLARIITATRQGGGRVVNLIYGVNGMVVGNTDELISVAEMLLQERDHWKQTCEKMLAQQKKSMFGPDIGGDGEVWGDHPSVLADQLKGKP